MVGHTFASLSTGSGLTDRLDRLDRPDRPDRPTASHCSTRASLHRCPLKIAGIIQPFTSGRIAHQSTG